MSAHRGFIEGSEDETENRAADIGGREDDQGHPPGHAQASFGEDKIRVILEGLRGEDSIAAICRRKGIAESLYCSWSKEFLEAGKSPVLRTGQKSQMMAPTAMQQAPYSSTGRFLQMQL